MIAKRLKNVEWTLPVDEEGVPSIEGASLAVLMDIRDELQRLNRIMSCFRVQRMSDDIHRIEKRLAKKVKLK